MKKELFIISFAAITSMAFAQNMRKNSQYSLFSDNKATSPGDAVTILVIESTQASNNSETTAGRKSELGLSASGAVGNGSIPNTAISLGSNNDFQGSGSTKTTGMISTKISATVDSILANGNMIISGNKKITINGEDQVVHIKGKVRPSDIRPDNSVYSYNISDAEISFEGNGIINNAQKPGWLTKIFNWLF